MPFSPNVHKYMQMLLSKEGRICLRPQKIWTSLRKMISLFYESSVRKETSTSDNDWLKLLWTDWFENLSDKFALKQKVKMLFSLTNHGQV